MSFPVPLDDYDPDVVPSNSSIKPSGAAQGGNAQFRLRVEPSPSPAEVWVLLSRHRVSSLDREFIGLNVTEGEAIGTRGATLSDFSVSCCSHDRYLTRAHPMWTGESRGQSAYSGEALASTAAGNGD